MVCDGRLFTAANTKSTWVAETDAETDAWNTEHHRGTHSFGACESASESTMPRRSYRPRRNELLPSSSSLWSTRYGCRGVQRDQGNARVVRSGVQRCLSRLRGVPHVLHEVGIGELRGIRLKETPRRVAVSIARKHKLR